MARRPRTLDDDLGAIREDIAALRDALGAINDEGFRAASSMRKTANRFSRNTADAGAEIWDRSIDLGNDAAGAIANGVSAVADQVKRNPVGTALIAIGVGFLLGALRR